MDVQIKGSNGITLMPLETRLMAERNIFIEGKIDAKTACDFVKKLIYLNNVDIDRPISVFINSEGGDINSGMLMYDAIQLSRVPIAMYCIGRAYSMGALLFASGNDGRYMLPHSELMLHEPLLGGYVGGSSSSIKSVSDSLMQTKRKMNKILAKHTGKTEEEIEEATVFDHYFTAKESVEFGLCDEVVNFDSYTEVR